MSEKKPHLNEQAMEDPSSIEIVTVGVKNSNTEIILKDHNLAPIPVPPLVQPPEEALPEIEAQVSHTNLGDKQDEEKIREHVQDMLLQIQAEESVHSPEESLQESNLDEQDNSSKSDKESEKKGGRSNYQSNDERRDDVPSSRRCFNKLCTSKKIYKKIRSRVEENKYRFFCKSCYENYSGNLFCEFCEQIYSTNGENEDDDKWIGCDRCDRWNHIDCERKFRDKNMNELKDKNFLYECLACTQKNKNNEKPKKAEKEDEKVTVKQKLEINKEMRTPIFNKKIETFPNLEYFLQNYSFRLWMNEGQIREDLQHLRNVCLKNANVEEITKNKGKKIKIQ